MPASSHKRLGTDNLIAGALHRIQYMQSSTFRWASAVAALFAVVVIALFGFVYLKIDDYLVARSDRMITQQIMFFAELPTDRRANAISYHLEQDSRGVQFVGLFDAGGRRLSGNLDRIPAGLKLNGAVQTEHLVLTSRSDRSIRAVRTTGRELPNGDVLVVGRNVDETAEISRVVGEALALGLLPVFCLCLLAGALLSVRAQKRVEEVNDRVQRIIAGDLKERLPHRGVDDPLSRLAAIVNGMLDEMESMINALAGVGNDIAHDLRTPLTRARLSLERGRKNATTADEFQNVIDRAIAGIDQSLTIVTALLRLTEIENSRRSAGFGDVALHPLLQEICDVYEPIAEDKDIELRVAIDCEGHVWGDRDLLFEALANLVDNAIKFTPAGGRVLLEQSRVDSETIVRVCDSGPGIGETEREAVLRRFYRSDKVRHTPGVGLGLSLVAAIIKLHGFRLVIHAGPAGRVDILCPAVGSDA